MKKIVFVFFSFLMILGNASAQGEFITRWELLNSGFGSNQIVFHATVATGGANFTWETIPSGTSGSGTLAAGTSQRTISGIPTGATIRLSIEPQNLQRFFSLNGFGNQLIRDVEQWGTTAWTSMENSFWGASNLIVSATDMPDLSNVTNMTNMFNNCHSLNGPTNIGQWDVSNVTTMSHMFDNALLFDQPLNNWDVSNVINMPGMFSGAQSFNQPLNNWDVSQVINMNLLFLNCVSFNQPINNWNVSNVGTMQSMFWNASTFNQPLNNWNVSNVTNMSAMFNIAYSFNQSLGSWVLNPTVNLNNVLNHSGIDCDNYSATLIGWAQNNPTVNNRILGATGLAHKPIALAARNQLLAQGWTITDAGMSGPCNAFETVWNLANPGSGANQLTFNATIATGGANFTWETIPAGTSGSGTLAAGTSLRTISGIPAGATIRLSIEPQNLQQFIINNGGDRQRIVDIEQWGAAPWTSMQNAFFGCNNLNISATDVPILSGVTNMAQMFRNCTSLNGPANIGQWNVSNVSDMQSMFRTASAFNQNVGTWNVSNVLNMFAMFRTATAFNKSLGPWVMSNAVNLTAILEGAGMDCETYSNTLIGWAANNPSVTNRTFDAQGIEYGIQAMNARNMLVNFQGWTINDGGMMPCGGEFITKWTMNAGYGGQNQIMFTANVASGGAPYFWETIPAGVTGSGILSAGNSMKIITGIPTGATIRLYIAPQNLLSFSIMFSIDEHRLLDVEQWGSTEWLTMQNMFNGAANLNITATDIPNMSNVSSMAGMFAQCHVLTGPTNINSWDISHVTNLSQTFFGARIFNQPLGAWNTSNVTDMSYMFATAFQFNQPIGSWNTGNVTFMQGMFSHGNYSFNYMQAPTITMFNQPLNSWNTSNVTDMSSMFARAINFNQPLDNWNTSNVTNMGIMFQYCISFNQPIGSWNVSNVTNFSGMFSGATQFNQPIGSWNTSNALNMQSLFQHAQSFNQPLNSWDVSNVTNMSGTFSNAFAFNQDLSSWNVSSTTLLFNAFYNAASFNHSLGSWILNPNVSLNNALSNSGLDCDNYSATLIGWAQNNPTLTNKNLGATGLAYKPIALEARNQLLAQGWTIFDAGMTGPCNAFETVWNLSNPGSGANQLTFNATIATGGANFTWETIPAGTSGSGILAAGTSLRTISGIPAGATIRLSIEPQNLQRFFINSGGDRERIVDIEQWGAAPWTSMQNAFFGCNNLNINATDIPNLSGVNNMAQMFRSCTSLNGPANIGQWNVSTISDMQQMFRSATSFNQDVSTWNVSNVLTMVAMFRSASSFNQNLGPWAMSNAVNLLAILENAGMDCENYSNTLLGWAANNPTAFNKTLDAQGQSYGVKGAAARSALINNQGWTINDAGFDACGGEFVTVWNLANTGNAPDQISFNAQIATGDGHYYWETIPAGNSGFGTLAAGNSNRTISGIPVGATIRLYLDSENLRRFYFNWNHPNVLRFVNLESWGTANWTSLEYMFYDCQSLVITATDIPNLSGVSSLESMFQYMDLSQGIPNIENWNTSTIVNMTRTFKYTKFNQNISNWDVSNVGTMHEMFMCAKFFNQPIGNWDVSNVVNFIRMFHSGCGLPNTFNQNLGSWVFRSNANLSDMLNRSGMKCENYSLTLVGWAQNNSTIVNKTIESETPLIYNASAITARNQLIAQGWNFIGDALAGGQPYLLGPNDDFNSTSTCAPLVLEFYNQWKALSVEQNGNNVDFSNITANARNKFVPSIPAGITTQTSGFWSGYYNLDNGATNVFRISRRMFTIQSPDVYPNNGGVLVRVYYHPNDFSSMINDPAPVPINDFGWYKSSSHNPQDIVNEMSLNEPMLASAIIIEDVTYGVENGVNYAEFLVESFSTFGMYAKHKNGPLPVTLTSFNANCQGETIQLNWRTASEFNASHYIIQNSRNGFTWTDLSEVEAAGTTNQATNYSFETKNFGGLSYFRLVQVDLDGASEIFEPVSSNCELENNSMTIYPNPTAENFTVRIETKESLENATLELIDNMGRVVLSRTVEIEAGTTTIPFENRDLQAGVYVLRMRGEGEKFKPVQVVRM